MAVPVICCADVRAIRVWGSTADQAALRAAVVAYKKGDEPAGKLITQVKQILTPHDGASLITPLRRCLLVRCAPCGEAFEPERRLSW